MHRTSLDKMEEMLTKYVDDISSKHLLDVGSLAVNNDATYKNIVLEKLGFSSYTGCDIRDGLNVDVVVPERDIWPQSLGKFDVIISGQTLEHVRWPWYLFTQMRSVLNPGGIMVHIAPNRWRYHEHPWDTFRYFPEGLRSLNEFVGLEVLEAGMKYSDTWCVSRRIV